MAKALKKFRKDFVNIITIVISFVFALILPSNSVVFQMPIIPAAELRATVGIRVRHGSEVLDKILLGCLFVGLVTGSIFEPVVEGLIQICPLASGRFRV